MNMTAYGGYSDQDLVILMKKDDAAFNEIYERYWSILYRSAFNVLKDEDLCLDVLQEVFIWVWEHRADLQVRSLKAYLQVAVKYKVANYIRNGKVRESFYLRIPKIELDTAFPDETLEVKELKEIIDRFVEELPARCREVFQLSRNEHLSNKDIAIRLGISEKTVENQINKGLKKLKLDLGRFSIFFSLLV
ncbi:putative ECF-type RNA polymerase sigma factor [Pedobacter sp. BAL39]|uniref:RNA polymerase sigma-70 factor n=1 Tax=Pedobacter sp. BAL39 TaxID=391596 RepID=UPI000155AC73|nr:RNA polymerase sigma-70 factor [Pedobacter sp. BAL39]EDM34153.1 putative ECF-type RNA polymerase sigma factor [Pedobacter sp. BAL39]